MDEHPQPSWYCLRCGGENRDADQRCLACGQQAEASRKQRQSGAAFLLNELETLRREGTIGDDTYRALRGRYRRQLGLAEEGELAPESPPAPGLTTGPPPAAPSQSAGPGWLAEQQANLLLYLGAFLIVVAALIFVSTSGEAVGDWVRMALLVAGTILFLSAGLTCLRFDRVRQAGVVFLAVGALMVPINFVGAYAFFFADEDIDATGLWLAGSLTSALFYAAVSLLRLGRWYPVPTTIAFASALAALLVLADAPGEAYPGSYIALALVFAAPAMLSAGRIRDTFGTTGTLGAHVIVPLSALTAFVLTGAEGGGWEGVELSTRWYLPPTIALAAFFYWTQVQRAGDGSSLTLTYAVAALGVAGADAVTIVYALDVGEQWYGPAVAIVGYVYATSGLRMAPAWFGRRYAGWMGLGAVTASWLLFQGLYADFPRHGAGVHFGGAAFYLVAARLAVGNIPWLGFASANEREGEVRLPTVPAAVGLIYAAGLTIGIGFYYLLASLPAAETAGASDLSWAFFGMSLGVAAVALTMRWWWQQVQPHVYAIAAGMSLFVLLASAGAEGQVTLLLAMYTGIALALVLWELQPFALPIPVTYGFFALLASWRHFEPPDAYLPLVVTAVGYAFFAVYVGLRSRAVPWSRVAQSLAAVYVVAAPIVGWVRLAILADPEGFVGTESFEETVLYQTTAAAVLLVGVLVGVQAWLVRRVELAIAASALAMVALLLQVGHFRPENIHAYSVPLGVYLFATASLSWRLETLPDDARLLIEPVQSLGAAVLMGPSLIYSWNDGGWAYALIVLGEGILLLGLALTQRWLWVTATSTGFIVLDGLRYLFNAAQALPSWVILLLAGTLVMAAGTAILLGRERWVDWQRLAQAWWKRESLPEQAS